MLLRVNIYQSLGWYFHKKDYTKKMRSTSTTAAAGRDTCGGAQATVKRLNGLS